MVDLPLLLVENPKLFESIGPQYQKANRVNPTFIAKTFLFSHLLNPHKCSKKKNGYMKWCIFIGQSLRNIWLN